MRNPVLTKELARIIEKSEIDALTSRLSAIKGMNGNPMGVEIQPFGNATAFSVRNIPGPSFNTVKGLSEGDEEHIDKIIEFYDQKNIPFRFELTPAHVSSKLLTHLHWKGYYQVDFHSTLYMPLSSDTDVCNDSLNPRIELRKLEENEFDIFADIYTKSFQMPSFLNDGVARNNEILYHDKSWTFYLASVNGEPAGVGVLFYKDKIASLATAATNPIHRKKGIQVALIQQRIREAIKQDCELLVGQARYGSTSQNNMERMGMRIAYSKSIWAKG